MGTWETVINNATNPIFARRMIYKITEYQKKHPNLDVDSIAEQFASCNDETKKEWAMYTNNMKAIVQICRMQRRIKQLSGIE